MGTTVISASAIFAAMSDIRPGRFYSVDELAVTLRVVDRTALLEQLRSMVDAPNVHDTFQLCQAVSAEFYRRVPFSGRLVLPDSLTNTGGDHGTFDQPESQN
jgi:hypothetical protein